MSRSDYGVLCGTRAAAIVASANKEFRKRILGRLGARSWTVEEAMGGAEALSLVEDGAFGALLLDRWLPDLDVQELVDIIKARHPHIQVLVLGSEAEERCLLEKLSPQGSFALGFRRRAGLDGVAHWSGGFEGPPGRGGENCAGVEKRGAIARHDGYERCDATGLSSGEAGDSPQHHGADHG